MFFTTNFRESGAVVGTIHNAKSLVAAQELRHGTVDLLETRIDALAALPNGAQELVQFTKVAGNLPAPLIVTVRHPKEGGAGLLSVNQRRTLFRQFLTHASLIDVELRSAAQLADVLKEARERGIGTILSHHDFRTTPPLARLQELASRAQEAGCTVFKVATMTRTARALTVLMEFLTGTNGAARVPLSVMGMGEFGKISRLTLGRAGSVLNYGYLDEPQVPGQWPAEMLKERLLELDQEGESVTAGKNR